MWVVPCSAEVQRLDISGRYLVAALDAAAYDRGGARAAACAISRAIGASDREFRHCRADIRPHPTTVLYAAGARPGLHPERLDAWRAISPRIRQGGGGAAKLERALDHRRVRVGARARGRARAAGILVQRGAQVRADRF